MLSGVFYRGMKSDGSQSRHSCVPLRKGMHLTEPLKKTDFWLRFRNAWVVAACLLCYS